MINILQEIKAKRGKTFRELAKTLGVTQPALSYYNKHPEKLTLEKINILTRRYNFSPYEKLLLFVEPETLKFLMIGEK